MSGTCRSGISYRSTTGIFRYGRHRGRARCYAVTPESPINISRKARCPLCPSRPAPRLSPHSAPGRSSLPTRCVPPQLRDCPSQLTAASRSRRGGQSPSFPSSPAPPTPYPLPPPLRRSRASAMPRLLDCRAALRGPTSSTLRKFQVSPVFTAFTGTFDGFSVAGAAERNQRRFTAFHRAAPRPAN
jgi:hypothetical protein